MEWNGIIGLGLSASLLAGGTTNQPMEKKEFLTCLLPEPTEFTCNMCDKKFEPLDILRDHSKKCISYEIILLINAVHFDFPSAFPS